jgi:hypothetical protein
MYHQSSEYAAYRKRFISCRIHFTHLPPNEFIQTPRPYLRIRSKLEIPPTDIEEKTLQFRHFTRIDFQESAARVDGPVYDGLVFLECGSGEVD